MRVVDVDVGSWAWDEVLDLLVARAGVTAVECRVHCLLLDNLLFDVVLFLRDLVGAWPWVLQVRLLGVRCLALIPPELASLCFGQEAGRVLADVLAFIALNKFVFVLLFNRNHGFVSAGSWLIVFNFCVLAIRDLGLEDAVVHVRIEIFGVLDLVVVVAGAGVGLLVDCRLKSLPLDFHRFKIYFR
jgi:hypothetical protein